MNNLALACELSLNDWLATFPDIIPEAEYSKNHEKWKKRLFNKMRDDYYHRFTTKTIKIMLVAAVLFALLLTAFVIPSSREFVLDKFEDFSAYQLTESNNNSVTGEIIVGYIPKGYELINKSNQNKYLYYEYKLSDNQFFDIYKCSSSMKLEFDTENFISEEIIVNGIKYIYCTGNLGVNNIIWTKNDYVYQIDATFNKEELLKIAKTVE